MNRVRMTKANAVWPAMPANKSCPHCGATVSPRVVGEWWTYRCPNRAHAVPAGEGKYRLVHRDEVPDSIVDEHGNVECILFIDDDGEFTVDAWGGPMQAVWEDETS